MVRWRPADPVAFVAELLRNKSAKGTKQVRGRDVTSRDVTGWRHYQMHGGPLALPPRRLSALFPPPLACSQSAAAYFQAHPKLQEHIEAALAATMQREPAAPLPAMASELLKLRPAGAASPAPGARRAEATRQPSMRKADQDKEKAARQAAEAAAEAAKTAQAAAEEAARAAAQRSEQAEARLRDVEERLAAEQRDRLAAERQLTQDAPAAQQTAAELRAQLERERGAREATQAAATKLQAQLDRRGAAGGQLAADLQAQLERQEAAAKKAAAELESERAAHEAAKKAAVDLRAQLERQQATASNGPAAGGAPERKPKSGFLCFGA